MMLKALDDKIMIAKQILLLSLDMINNGIVALLCHVLETGTVNDLTIKSIKKLNKERIFYRRVGDFMLLAESKTSQFISPLVAS